MQLFISRGRWVALFALLTLAACGRRAVPLNTTTPVALEAQADPAELRAAIIRALEARRFVTESDQPGRIVGRFSHRGRTLRLAIDYTPTDYRITYVDSAGMGYQVGRDGVPMISRHYDSWVRRLRDTIQDELGRPERERQEAIERDRQHQLQLAQAETQRQVEAQRAEERARERDRQERLEIERLRTQRAQAEAEARRPIIVNHPPQVVTRFEVAPRRRIQARFQSVRLGRRAGARWLRGQAEGRVDASSLGLPGGCRGHFSGTPEHVITVRRDLDYLRLETDAEGDPTLVLVAADGAVYCDDDGGQGLNSRIEGSFPAGTYRVFVGSYRAGQSATYRLLVTGDRAPQGQPVVTVGPSVQPAAPAGPDCRTLVIQRGHPASSVRYCAGAEPYCAEALIGRGWPASGLSHCQGVEPTCAQAMIARGWPPSGLDNCRGVDPQCAQTMISAGHPPSAVANCR